MTQQQQQRILQNQRGAGGTNRNSRFLRISRHTTVSVLLLLLIASSISSLPTCNGFRTTLPIPKSSNLDSTRIAPTNPLVTSRPMSSTNNNHPPNTIHRGPTSHSPTPNTPFSTLTTKPINRSRFFSNSVISTALLLLLLPSTPNPSHATTPTTTLTTNEALTQLQNAISTTSNLLTNWETITSKGGDAIRAQIGTNGGNTPLFQISKALKILQTEAEDPVAFAEASEEYILAIGRADSMAYSANFAGGSGKPTPPAVYIEKSRGEVRLIKKYEKEMLEAYGNGV